MWVDSHCHLHLAEENEEAFAVVERARAESVDQIVCIGIEAASSRRACELAERFDLVFSAGVHPNSSDEWTDSSKQVVEELLAHDRCVAVGETGLDFFRDYVSVDIQCAAFEEHIELAKRFGKALVIHTRDSLDAALDMIESKGPPERLVFHCWSAGGDLQRALDTGAHISFAGNVSFKKAEDLRADAALVPEDRLLIETDSPFLSPEPFRGKPNEPARVTAVGAAVADARGADVEETARITSANAVRLFGLKS